MIKTIADHCDMQVLLEPVLESYQNMYFLICAGLTRQVNCSEPNPVDLKRYRYSVFCIIISNTIALQ